MKKKKVNSLEKKYRLKTKILGDTIYITSRYDEWYIENCSNKYRLHHKNTKFDRNKYHVQGKFDTLEETFKYIFGHDEFKQNHKTVSKRYNRLQYLFTLI